MKLKIAVLGVKGIPHTGGIEIIMEEVCTRLVQRGHKVDIFVRRNYMEGKALHNYKGVGLPFSRGVHNKNFDAISHSITALLKILISGYDIVYFNSVGLSVLSWIPRLFGMKTVVHTHGLDWKREKWSRVAKAFLRFSAYTSVKCPNLTISCLGDKRFLETTYGKHCEYVPNGAPQMVFRQPELIKKYGLNEKDYILFMSRLVPEKGCHFLLEAWEGLPEIRKKGMKLVIAGDTNFRDTYYYNLIEYKRLKDVIFTGFASGSLKNELHSNAYCFVQPSTIEGLPISILEALSYGLFVIASDITENKDTLKDCGVTFRNKDIDDLRLKIEEAINMSPDLLKTESIKAEETVEKEYNWEHVVDKIEMKLSGLLS